MSCQVMNCGGGYPGFRLRDPWGISAIERAENGHAPVRAAHGPESGQCHGSASTGIIAFAGMARSYNRSPVHMTGGASITL